MVSNWTLGLTLSALMWLYLIGVTFAIIRATLRARNNRRDGIAAYEKQHAASAKLPHPKYVGHYTPDDEVRHNARREYNEDNEGRNGPLLWLHVLLPALIGTILGLILVSTGGFASWIDDLMDDHPDTFTGFFEVILAFLVCIGVILALFLPFELSSKKKTNWFDYALVILAGFSLPFAFICLTVPR